MKLAALNAIFLLLLGVQPLLAAHPTGVWEYSSESQQYIDGFNLFQMVGTAPDSEIDVDLELSIPPEARNVTFSVIGPRGECRDYYLKARDDDPVDGAVFSNPSVVINYCIDQPDAVLIFSVQ